MKNGGSRPLACSRTVLCPGPFIGGRRHAKDLPGNAQPREEGKAIAAEHIKSGGVVDDAGDGAVDALALRGATHNIAVRKVLVDGKPVLNDTREATQAYLRTRISHGTSFQA